MEVRFKLNKKIQRDKKIITWLLKVPVRERPMFIREKLAENIGRSIKKQRLKNQDMTPKADKIEKAIEKFANF